MQYATTMSREYSFEAAHSLPKVPDGHKCKRVHGHNYVLHVLVHGDVADNGMIMDFWDLDKIVKPIVEIVDHRNLNDIEGLDNPTAELIARWFLNKIRADMPEDYEIAVRLYETPQCFVEVIVVDDEELVIETPHKLKGGYRQ
jgi:6-pyruvoyltetrahydropterin/6-carboxytetrahydropterin synthase